MSDTEVLAMLIRWGFDPVVAAHMVETQCLCGCNREGWCEIFAAQDDLLRAQSRLDTAKNEFERVKKKYDEEVGNK